MSEAAGTVLLMRAPGTDAVGRRSRRAAGVRSRQAVKLGQAVAGLSADAKGVSLGTIEPRPELVREQSDRLAEGEQRRLNLR